MQLASHYRALCPDIEGICDVHEKLEEMFGKNDLVMSFNRVGLMTLGSLYPGRRGTSSSVVALILFRAL